MLPLAFPPIFHHNCGFLDLFFAIVADIEVYCLCVVMSYFRFIPILNYFQRSYGPWALEKFSDFQTFLFLAMIAIIELISHID